MRSSARVPLYRSRDIQRAVPILWVDNLIVPTLIVHQFLRSEREGDWFLQQLCLQRMLPNFFAAKHIHYARYITWHLLDMRCLPAAAKADLVSGAFVCRHRHGGSSLSEQTAIKIGNGITLYQEMVTEWLSAFPIGAYICDTVDRLYEEDHPNEKEVLNKEERLSRRRLDADDRRCTAELSKHSHPRDGQGENNVMYNLVNGKIA